MEDRLDHLRPPLAWGAFSWLSMARFLPESVRDELAHDFERLEQTEEDMRVKRFVRGLREYIFRSVVGSNCSTFAELSGATESSITKGVVLVGSLLAQHRVVDQIMGDLHGPLFHNGILE
ncbi:hypothetical protein SESBI_12793 [Sesbania bispinosa]|nr:hypothetical protein SESBI_12793 [Sesbania bispinosa]